MITHPTGRFCHQLAGQLDISNSWLWLIRSEN